MSNKYLNKEIKKDKLKSGSVQNNTASLKKKYVRSTYNFLE